MDSKASILQNHLSTHRSRCNALFHQARHAYPRLDGNAFGQWLVETLAPLLDQTQPPFSEAAIDGLYLLGLELFARDYAGPNAQGEESKRLFLDLLPHLSRAVNDDPEHVPAELFNALHQLRLYDADLSGFCQRLAKIGPQLDSAANLRAMALVTAWRSGLAQFRTASLDLMENLPAKWLLPLFQDKPVEAEWHQCISQLRKNRWYHPDKPLEKQPQFRLLGGFSGFGGPFKSPPLVAFDQDHFWATDGHQTFTLFFDAFGATLVNSATAFPKSNNHHSDWTVRPDSQTVRFRDKTMDISQRPPIQDWASDAHTCLLVSPFSHDILIIPAR